MCSAQKNGAGSESLKAIGVFPLSCMQENLWVIEQMAPRTPAYNLMEAWRLEGRLDPALLQHSLTAILGRHEALRTIFRNGEHGPEQVVLKEWEMSLPFLDLSSSPDEQTALQAFLWEESARTFCLEKGPLWRVNLVQLAPEVHVLITNMHHIISDAWSQHLFIRELYEFYAAGNSNRAAAVPELPIQYADFAVWQRQTLNSRPFDRELEFWKRQLANAPVLNLPTDLNRPQTPSWGGHTDFASVSKALTDDLKQVSRSCGVTLFVTLLAAFKAWLHRCTHDSDLVVGSPFSARDRVELENLIGYFVNTHALRTRVEGDPTFPELLRQVREVVLEAANQPVPLTTLLTALKPQRQPGTHPLFHVVFGLQNAVPDEWHWPELVARRIDLHNGSAKFDWTLLATDTGQGLRLRSETSADLFRRETPQHFLQSFQTLLEAVAEAPELRLSELPLVSRTKESIHLGPWNETAAAYERDSSVAELFTRQAQVSPDAIALELGDQVMTYAQLHQLSDRVAYQLRQAGARPGSIVGLGIRRSFEMIIGMLAILKNEAAFLPLDADYPIERLGYMLRDSKARLVLVDRHFPLTRLGGAECKLMLIDEALRDDIAVPAQPNHVVAHGQNGNDPAYVMYTSGTTGKPKGVSVPHRGITRLVRNAKYARFGPDEVFLQLSPISFDASTFEIWGALLNGGRLVLFPPELPSLQTAARVIAERKVTILWLTAGFFNQMVDHEIESLRGVRQLLTGGEALSVPHVLKAVRVLENCQLINGYGPTENTTFTCCYSIPRDWQGERSVPIGTPVSNTRVWVLDRHLKPVPVGVAGELCAGGDGLACGYINQPELTREKFVEPGPETPSGIGRFYRTGDMVRWRPDGTLEFLGRIDEQVKIRGFRVEPSEIEAALADHRGLLRSAVLALKDNSGTHRLVAYVVPNGQEAISNSQVREFLSERLPAFMVPSQIVQVDELPLTPNGKIDRRALPCPHLLPHQPAAATVPPRTETERKLQKIWLEVLGRNSFGVEDDFFELGGHSLLAIQVITRIARTFKQELPVRALFDSPTIAGLAQALDRGQPQPPDPMSNSRIDRMHYALEHLDTLSDAEVDSLLRDPELNDFPR